MPGEDPRETAPPVSKIPELFAAGADRYNDAAYWEAHEDWEAAWHSLRAEDREADARFLRGAILGTAAFENLSRGKPDGYRRQMAKALIRLRELAGRGDPLLGWANEDEVRGSWTDHFLEAMTVRDLTGFDDIDAPVPRIHARG